MEIAEVMGYEQEQVQLKTLYRFEETGEDEEGRVVGELSKKGELTYAGKLRAAGL